MRILGIDTSCDDTCISIIENKNQKSKTKTFDILSNTVSSQAKLHAKYGGVWPFLAKREHQKNLPLVFKKAIKEVSSSIFNFPSPFWKRAGFKQIPNIDLIGVTAGPGLEPCLWQGVNFAKELAEQLKIPIIPVNHIEGHIIANWLPSVSGNSKFQIPNSKQIPNSNDQNPKQIRFPAICLVVSGGHTQLILMKDIGKYKLIGETRDDAAGECFDKVARILGLGYPGGPAIAKTANLNESNSRIFANKLEKIREISLPRPMMYTKDYDFSFSGLKTAVLYDFRKRSPKMRKSKIYIQEMCKEVQQTIIDVLIHKTLRAARNFKVKSVILGGGVAANDELRKQFSHRSSVISHKLKFLVPPKNLCTDNAAMVAVTAYFHQKAATKNLEKIKVNANLRI